MSFTMLASALLALLACLQEPAVDFPGQPLSAASIPKQGSFSRVVLSGHYSSVRRVGTVTEDEVRVLHRAEPSEWLTLLDLFYTWDFQTFQPDRAFAGLAWPAGDPFELGGFESLSINSNQSPVPWYVPADLSRRRVVFNNAAAAWGDHGPLWGMRDYNVVGLLEDLEIWRCGDWTRGREGHAIYFNVLGPLTIRDFTAAQCGGQAIQIVWRPSETQVPRTAWPGPEDPIRLERVTAKDCGSIVTGQAVRASWPISIFATGAPVEIVDLTVETNLPVFDGGTAGPSQSHGAFLNSSGEEGRRTPILVINGLHGRIVDSDRSEMRITSANTVQIRRVDIVEVGGDGMATLDFVEDCDSLVIEECDVAVRVKFARAAQPWSTYRETVVAPGERFEWRKP